MNGQSERLYFAYLTEPREVGEGTPHSPQHLTLVPPFLANRGVAIEAAQKVSANIKQFPIRIGETANFGDKEQIEVRLVEPVHIVQMVHNFLLEELQSSGVDVNKLSHIKENYVPHITIKNRHLPLQSGERLVIDHIGVMLKTDKDRTLVHREDLEK